MVEKVLSLPSIPGQDKTLTQSIVASLLRPTGSAPLTKASAMLACRDTNAHSNADCESFALGGMAGSLPKDLEMGLLLPDSLYANKAQESGVRIRPDSLLLSEVALKAGPLGHLLIDPFGNYCMQKLLKVIDWDFEGGSCVWNVLSKSSSSACCFTDEGSNVRVVRFHTLPNVLAYLRTSFSRQAPPR